MRRFISSILMEAEEALKRDYIYYLNSYGDYYFYKTSEELEEEANKLTNDFHYPSTGKTEELIKHIYEILSSVGDYRLS